jgi:pimeloyl-ACP methyl ester carboxylesterase
VNERAVTFGAHGGLVGVLSEPATPVAGARRAVIFSNIGMHHRVGPFRIYVELARRLAASGFPVLRFDLAGMGDSAPRHDAPTPAGRAERDLDDAMKFVTETLGITEFVLIGLCSGVDSTHAMSSKDPRVVGAAFIDGYAYPTLGFKLRHYFARPLQLGRWVRFLRRRLGMDPPLVTEAADQPAVFVREAPTEEQFRNDVAAMTSRGARLLFVYTGGVYFRFNSARQMFETLGPGAPKSQIEVTTDYSADHLFTHLAKRAELLAQVDGWVKSIPR